MSHFRRRTSPGSECHCHQAWCSRERSSSGGLCLHSQGASGSASNKERYDQTCTREMTCFDVSPAAKMPTRCAFAPPDLLREASMPLLFLFSCSFRLGFRVVSARVSRVCCG